MLVCESATVGDVLLLCLSAVVTQLNKHRDSCLTGWSRGAHGCRSTHCGPLPLPPPPSPSSYRRRVKGLRVGLTGKCSQRGRAPASGHLLLQQLLLLLLLINSRVRQLAEDVPCCLSVARLPSQHLPLSLNQSVAPGHYTRLCCRWSNVRRHCEERSTTVQRLVDTS